MIKKKWEVRWLDDLPNHSQISLNVVTGFE